MKNVMKIVMGAIAFVCACGANGARREMPRSDSGDTLEASLGMEHRLHKVIDQVERGEKPFEALECRAKKDTDEIGAIRQAGSGNADIVDEYLVSTRAPHCVREALRKLKANCVFELGERCQRSNELIVGLVRENISQARRIEALENKINALKENARLKEESCERAIQSVSTVERQSERIRTDLEGHPRN